MINQLSPAVLSLEQSEARCSNKIICEKGRDCYFDYGGSAQAPDCGPCTFSQCANIGINVEPSKPIVEAAQVAKVTVSLFNKGKTYARNLRLRIDLPLQTSVVKTTVAPPIKPHTPMTKAVPYGNSLYFIITSVAAGETRKFTVSYLINEGLSGFIYIKTSLDDKNNYYCDQVGPTVKVSFEKGPVCVIAGVCAAGSKCPTNNDVMMMMITGTSRERKHQCIPTKQDSSSIQFSSIRHMCESFHPFQQ